MNWHLLSDDECEAVHADLCKLVTLKNQVKNAMRGASLRLAQRESCEKAAFIPEEKIKKLNEKLMVASMLRDCDQCNILRHYHKRPR